MHETWEAFARDIHFAQAEAASPMRSSTPGCSKSTVSSARSGRRCRRIRPDRSKRLRRRSAFPRAICEQTVDAFNAAATGDPARFDAARCDGLAAADTLKPPKSNWARAIAKPPFLAYPLVGAIAYTFGGLATNDKGGSAGRAGADARASTPREKPPGISTAPRRTRLRCCARWFSEKLRDERLSDFLHRR